MREIKKIPQYNHYVSIIIPLYVITDRFFKDFKKFDNLSYENFEIIVVCDKKIVLPKLQKHKVRLILTKQKQTGPAEKRDLALKFIKGSICAFIDDDAYPDKHWLRKAIPHFKNKDIVAVGGPGVTPPDDNFWEKIGGYIIESYLCSGGIQYRFYPTNAEFYVKDYPAYNLLVRTDKLKLVGGYGSTFYGGEDTLLCLKLIKYGKIIYDSEVIVYHHRRAFPAKLSKQIAGVGLHRGYFFKKYPETSRTFFYLIPSILSLGLLLFFITALIYPKLFLIPFLLVFFGFVFLGTLSVQRHNVPIRRSIIAGFGIIVIHITYGIYFVKGLMTDYLER